MLISDSHEFIFVHNRKVAGTSMRERLAPHALPRPAGTWNKVLSRMGLRRPYHTLVLRQHEPILTARRCMPADLFSRYLKFAFVRNPWDRLVSEYEFLRRKADHGRHRRVAAMHDFGQFVRFQIPRQDAYQLNLLVDERGEICLDLIGRFESLEEDFAEACRRIGVEVEPLPHLNPSERGDYRGYYTPELAELVARHWAAEIAAFGYRFGG